MTDTDKRDPDRQRNREVELLYRAVARLRAGIMAAVFATVGGTGLWLATIWLLIRGGPNLGQHLALLGNYFPGYSVTWPGAFVGLFYGALTGWILGWCVAWIYNLLVGIRQVPGADTPAGPDSRSDG